MQTTGLERTTLDKFYTKEEVMDLCIEKVKQHLTIDSQDLVLEPSAGNGAFLRGIQTLSASFLLYDLEPEHPAILQNDYLQDGIDFGRLRAQYPRIHVITNPPFGRQSSLAQQFIKKSCTFAHSVSFILPKSFKKASRHRCFPMDFHLIFEMDLPDNSFLVNQKEHDVPCIFQIWERKSFPRDPTVQLEPCRFRFVKKDEDPDLSFRRVGVNAGTIDTCIEKSIQSHYFIKLDHPTPELIQRLSQLTYSTNNTVGPRSISKQELIAAFNPLL
jgi:predicted RNA methylase